MTGRAGGFSWDDAAAPLLALGAKLGITRRQWQQAEELEMLTGPTESYPLGAFRGATGELAGLAMAYGDALGPLVLRLSAETIESGDYPEEDHQYTLDVVAEWRRAGGHQDGDPEAVAALVHLHIERFLLQFREPAKDRLVLDLTLDKTALATRALAVPPGVRLGCFLFPDALAARFRRLHYLGSGTGEGSTRIEQWWNAQSPQKLIVLVPAWRTGEPPEGRTLNGPLLAVIGGDPTELWPQATEPASPAIDPPAAYRLRRDGLRLHWEAPWFHNLTPVHLQTAGSVPADDPLATPLRWQFANLAVLYTADSARRDADGWIVTFQGAGGRVPVRLLDAPEKLEPMEAEAAGVWTGLFEWIYGSRFAPDRLVVLQNVVVRELWGVEPEAAFRRLLARMKGIEERTRLGWTAFVEAKVDAFFSQAQVLEDHVAATVRAFADQTAGMLKRLFETVLAAVAVVVAALVLPAIREGETDFRVLWWGLLVYSAYVFVFPLIYGMSQQWQEHRDLQRQFEERYLRFRKYLPTYWVEAVGRGALDRSLARYRAWFWVTLATYVALLGLLTIALLAVG